MLGSNADFIAKINLSKKNLCIRRFGEGNFFGQIKMMCILDDVLYTYCIDVQNHYIQRPLSTKTSFVSRHNRLRIAGLIKEYITTKIVTEVNSNAYGYGLAIDSTKDVSSKHQFSVVIKYVTISNIGVFKIQERTIFFKALNQLTGNEIYHSTRNWLEHIGLPIQKLSGNILI